jgi:hypothetical protein
MEASPKSAPPPASDGRAALEFGPNGEPILSDFGAVLRRRQAREADPQRYPRDGFFFYPRNRCLRCLGDDWAWEQVSGSATVVSYTIDRISMVPGFRSEAPYFVAIVKLDEGPTMPTRITGCAPADVSVGAKVKAKAVPRGNVFIFEFALV